MFSSYDLQMELDVVYSQCATDSGVKNEYVPYFAPIWFGSRVKSYRELQPTASGSFGDRRTLSSSPDFDGNTVVRRQWIELSYTQLIGASSILVTYLEAFMASCHLGVRNIQLDYTKAFEGMCSLSTVCNKPVVWQPRTQSGSTKEILVLSAFRSLAGDNFLYWALFCWFPKTPGRNVCEFHLFILADFSWSDCFRTFE